MVLTRAQRRKMPPAETEKIADGEKGVEPEKEKEKEEAAPAWQTALLIILALFGVLIILAVGVAGYQGGPFFHKLARFILSEAGGTYDP